MYCIPSLCWVPTLPLTGKRQNWKDTHKQHTDHYSSYVKLSFLLGYVQVGPNNDNYNRKRVITPDTNTG